jgi:2,3-dihydroxybenzoate-AMP ligase
VNHQWTGQHIAFHAAERPDAVAIVDDGRAFTYAQLTRNLARFTMALREFGLPPGATTAVGCKSFYIHWLLLLGLERLGVATASLLDHEDRSSRPLLASADLVISEQAFPAESARRHHPITPAWLERVLALEPKDESETLPRGPDDVIRILRTSGTTGVYKRLRMPRQMFDIWVNAWIWFHGLSKHTRFLITMPFTVAGSYIHATACLRAGGTVFSETRTGVARALSNHGITHVILVPIHLAQVLNDLPADYPKPVDLMISSLGAPVSAALRERAINRLARDVKDMYGTNEVGFVATTSVNSRNGLAAIWPGVEVEIVDEHDVPLPRAQAGRVRVKTDCMASGYIDDPEATMRMFKDGWFYPGDIGILYGPRCLQIVGRGDELLNIGGTKFAPGALEDMLLSNGIAAEVAVCSIPNRDGIEEVCIAVPVDNSDNSTLLKRAELALRRLQVGNFHVVRVARIPRTGTGKIQRNLLKDEIAGAVAPRTGTPPKA